MNNELLSTRVNVVLEKESILYLAGSLAVAGIIIILFWGIIKKMAS